uniref:Uncharacterized protein n=1 Tax=Prasinoderma coloniale TaxID=156133 RepID=A0A7R9TEH6_9VIRI
MVKKKPVQLRHLMPERPVVGEQSGRNMWLEGPVQISASCSRWRVRSSITRGTARAHRMVGPWRRQKEPRRLEVTPFQCTYCVRLVRQASVTAAEIEWLKLLAAAEAVTPSTPAKRRGQHHEPSSAGTETATVKSADHSSPLPCGAAGPLPLGGAGGTATAVSSSHAPSMPHVVQSSSSAGVARSAA